MAKIESTEHAHVVSRRLPCSYSTCRKQAHWDVSLINRWGQSSEWVPMCGRHARVAASGQTLPAAPALTVVGDLGPITLVSADARRTGGQERGEVRDGVD